MTLDKRISDHLVRLVGIMFGVVVVQSFVRYDDLVIDPFNPAHRIGIAALFVVYFTVVMSWVDWHIAMELRPYALNPRNRSRRTELVRLWADLTVVAVYAYLLLTIQEFAKQPERAITRHLVGYPLVFSTYLASGITRRISYGRYASNVRVIGVFFLIYVSEVAGYWCLQHSGLLSIQFLNLSALAEAFLLMILYRLIRRGASDSRRRKKESGKVIGIDVDGVLANQIEGMIPRVEARTGIKLRYKDVTEWKLPLGNTDIEAEIGAAMEDDAYILEMPLHNGAQRVVETLFESHRIFVITARPERTRETTEQWLVSNKIPYDRIVNVKAEQKSLYRTDILIDDYLGNSKDFLSKTDGVVILVDQPWNRKRKDLENFMSEGRLHIASNLEDALRILQELWSKEKAAT